MREGRARWRRGGGGVHYGSGGCNVQMARCSPPGPLPPLNNPSIHPGTSTRPGGVPKGPGRPPLQVTPGQPSRKEEEFGGAELVAFNIDIPNIANQSGTSEKEEVEAELLSKGSAGAGNRKLPPPHPRAREAVDPLNQSGALGVVGQESDWLAGRSTWNRGNRWIKPCRTLQ